MLIGYRIVQLPDQKLTTPTNPLRQLWADGQGTVGGWCEIPSSLSAEVMSRCGFDWVCVDWQHGLASLETVANMVQAISIGGSVPLVRVPFNEPWLIMNVLDVGAYGVIVPLVNNNEDAKKAAAACRYPPRGIRSFGPIRTAVAIGPDPIQCNDEILCIVMIETAEAVDNAASICATPGVDGVFIGPVDLGLSFGHDPNLDAIDRGPIDQILHACRASDVAPGIHCASGTTATTYLQNGFLFTAVASDRDFLASASRLAVQDTPAAVRNGSRLNIDHICRTVIDEGV